MRQFRLMVGLCGIAALALAGCHSEVPLDVALLESKIGIPDKFYDVRSMSATEAFIVGYAGKILHTGDGGKTWDIRKSGTRKALYSIEFSSPQKGWVTGQEGMILHTADGGQTWERQQSGTVSYLFAVDFVDDLEGWAVGDKATYSHTIDGGKTWRSAKIIQDTTGASAEEALVSQDPVLYDVQFVDRDHGWIVGEFGKIYHTSDAGQTWVEQQQSLTGDSVTDAMDLPTFFGVQFLDANQGMVAGLEGRVARTTDGGATWKFEEFDVAIPLTDPLYQAYTLPDGVTWAVGAAGQVVSQASATAPFKVVELGMELNGWLRDVEFFDSKSGWIVGGYGRILRTTDGGKTWLQMLG